MKKFLYAIVLAWAVLTCASCQELDIKGMMCYRGASTDERFIFSTGKSSSAALPQQITVDCDQYRLWVMTDVHLNGTTENLDKFVERRIADQSAAPFVLCLGDLQNGKSDFNAFANHTLPLEKADIKMFVTAGNHDLYWGRWDQFAEMFKTSTYAFEVRTPSAADLYICVESGGATLGSQQTEWLRNLLESRVSSYRNLILFTHTHFFKRDWSQGHTSNYPLDETYALADLFSKNGVDLVITGHDHSHEITDFKGVRYVIVDALEDIKENAGYALFTIGNDIGIEFVPIN